VLEAIALAFGLAMDATAMAAVRGLTAGRREAVILPLLFGVFQAGMAALGWALGAWGGRYIEAWDHWIAFVLLAGIGVKMLIDAWRGTAADEPHKAGAMVLLGLALATSIDAAAAGITLPLILVPPWLALVLIGGVTAGCSAIGFLLGRTAGRWLGGKLTAVGGLILIGIGVRILVQHL
jgi:putative Mn2+ efflux pump MntP